MSSFLCVFVCLFFIAPKDIPNTQAVPAPGVPVCSVTELSEDLRVVSENLRTLFQTCPVFSFILFYFILFYFILFYFILFYFLFCFYFLFIFIQLQLSAFSPLPSTPLQPVPLPSPTSTLPSDLQQSLFLFYKGTPLSC